jgi:hypothetical protein
LVVTVASSGVQSSGVNLRDGSNLPYGHVFRSKDFGDTWEDIDGGKLPNVVYYAAAYESTEPYRLFIAGDVGVWAEMEKGWLNISGNLPSVIVSDLVYHQKTGTLTAATYGRGIWRIKPGDLTKAAPARKKPVDRIDIATGLRVDPSVPAPVQMNPPDGAAVDDPQRKTVVTVQPVPNAIGYQVELMCQNTPSVGFGSWTAEITFNGFNPGKAQWRVWAILPDGLRSPASPWRNIKYSN